MKTADYYISKLGLASHIEGGAFKETYRSSMILPHASVGNGFKADRNASTAIYFLLKYGQFSAFHRIASDEMWHFYDGDTLTIYEITAEGKLVAHRLGRDLEKGESFQVLIKAGSWFGSRCEVEKGFSLAACTVAPGFDFADFELANKGELTKAFPQHRQIITELTAG